LQRGLRDAELGVDRLDGVVEAAHRGKLLLQADREPALHAEARIGLRLLSGAELLLQIIELVVEINQIADHLR